MKKNSGFMLFETLIVSTLVLGTLVFLYVQLTKIKNSYYESFRYNTVEGLYYANNLAKYLEKTGYASIKERLNNSTYVDITDCILSTSFCSKIIKEENIKQVLFVNKDITSFKENLDNMDLNKNFKRFIKRIPNYKKRYAYRLIVAYENDTYATVGVGIDLSELTRYTLNNKINNNGFEEGKTNWNITGNANLVQTNINFKKSGNKSLEISSAENFDENNETGVYQTVKLDLNHLYYVSEEIYLMSDSNGYMNIYLNDNNNYSSIFLNSLKVEKWNLVSGLFKADVSGNYKFNALYLNDGYKAYVDNIILVDLTSTFGAGNEPDKDWCDSHIKYFDSSTVLYK